MRIQTWLGHIFNISINQLFVTETRVKKLEQSLANILGYPSKVTARQLAAVAGQIVGTLRFIGRQRDGNSNKTLYDMSL